MGVYYFDKNHQNFIGTQFEWDNLTSKEKMQYQLITIADFYHKKETNIIKIKHSHCKCCGAPINPYKEKCDYCGVYYTKEVN